MGTHPTQTTHLAESLCARLCHEMSGPLGTVMGALELAGEDPDSAVESLQLAQEAAAQMVARLRLSRAAWAGDCGPLDAAGLADLAAGLPARARLEVGGLAGRFPQGVARVLVNMVLLAMDALPRGGTISVSGAPDSDVVLMVSGPHAAWPPGLALALADPLQAPLDEPRAVQAPLAALLALKAGLRLSLLFDGSGREKTVAPLLLGAP
jgi:histidine phosphotransferase ChpT